MRPANSNLYDTPKKQDGGRGVVIFDFALAVLITILMLHFAFVISTLVSMRTAERVQHDIVFEKTAAYADFLVKDGLAIARGGALAQHEIGMAETLRIGDMEKRAEEYGLAEPKIGIESLGGAELAGSFVGEKNQANRVCVTRLVLFEKQPAKLIMCSDWSIG